MRWEKERPRVRAEEKPGSERRAKLAPGVGRPCCKNIGSANNVFATRTHTNYSGESTPITAEDPPNYSRAALGHYEIYLARVLALILAMHVLTRDAALFNRAVCHMSTHAQRGPLRGCLTPDVTRRMRLCPRRLLATWIVQ